MIGPCHARLYGAVIRKSTHIALVLDMGPGAGTHTTTLIWNVRTLNAPVLDCLGSASPLKFDLSDLKGTMNMPHVTDQALWLLLEVYH